MKVGASTLMETIVASIISLLTFVAVLAVISRLTVITPDTYDFYDCHYRIGEMIDSWNIPLDEGTMVFDWGKMDVTMHEHESYPDMVWVKYRAIIEGYPSPVILYRLKNVDL